MAKAVLSKTIARAVGATAGAVACALVATSVVAAGDEMGEATKYTGTVEDHAKVCAIQDTVHDRAGVEYTYNGKKYHVCCPGCIGTFKKDPAKYSQATDPVNGRAVDKADAPIYAHNGQAYYFSSADTLAAFAKEPGKYIRGTRQKPAAE